MSEFPYLHGFSEKEQQRLRDQATFLEWIVYQDVNLSTTKDLLEVGCGVGAQTEILLRRFPHVHVTAIDLNPVQLGAAQKNLQPLPGLQNRWDLKQMSGSAMTFADQSFDASFLCWILEHVPAPAEILAEVKRVLRPGGEVFITEVMNSSFFLDPYSPNVWKYWTALNDYQFDQAGDPFVGVKLGNLLKSTGFHDIQTTVKTMHFDNRNAERRKSAIDYWTELMLSAADSLMSAKYIDAEILEGTKNELAAVALDPNAVFFYSFMQARAKA
jgi:ubiquinone/menaquinone biosynthesis C-methylase UbiE